MRQRGSWLTLAVAPSFAAFVGRPEAALTDVMACARALVGARIDVVAVDMPLATKPIRTRREADNQISRAFGAAKCSTHSPTPERPGPLAAHYRDVLAEHGLPLATTSTSVGTTPAAIEVYPHPALLRLLGRDERVPYKVGRASKYWPATTPDERRARLLAEWRLILAALAADIGAPPLTLPAAPRPRDMKPLEDQIDALVSAWVGVRYAEGRARAYGDETAAIWCPS